MLLEPFGAFKLNSCLVVQPVQDVCTSVLVSET